MLADFINGANVGMVQGGSGLRLTVESPQSLRVRRELVRQELQGHKAVKLGVLGLVHHAHPTTAKLFDNAVVRDGLPNQKWCTRHLPFILGCTRNQVNEDKRLSGKTP